MTMRKTVNSFQPASRVVYIKILPVCMDDNESTKCKQLRLWKSEEVVLSSP